MDLKVMQPAGVEVTEEVRKVSAEGTHGAFTLLPRHVDFVASLQAGLLSFESPTGQETFLAIDGGVLVKCGQEVWVSTPRSVRGSLGELHEAVNETFKQASEREQQAASAVEKMEADFIRRFVELQHGQ